MGPIEQYSSYHNELGNGFSITDPSTWVDIPGNAVKFTAAALGSGLNSFYNTGVAVGNLFGAEWEERDTYAWLSSMDADVGQYYRENQQAADLVGFVAGSFLPGTLGVKAFNYGLKAAGLVEAGSAAANATLHTGVRGVITRNFTQEALAQYKQTGAMFNAWNRNFLGAVGKGVAKETIDATVFEVAATATMFKSPILEDMDVEDLAWNTLAGAAVGGVIGGAFKAAKITKEIKTGIQEIDYVNNQFGYRSMAGEALGTDVKMGYALADKARLQALVPENERQATILKNALTDIDVDVRKYSHEWFKGDPALGNYFADRIIKSDPKASFLQMLNTDSLGRVGDALPTFEEYMSKLADIGRSAMKKETRLEELIAKKAAGGLDEKQFAKITAQIEKATEAVAKTDSRLATKTIIDPVTGNPVTKTQKLEAIYYDLHTGNTFTGRPGSLNVADVLVRDKGQTIKQAFETAISKQKFGLGKGILEFSPDQAELRYAWAERNFGSEIKETLEEGAVTWDDLPVLQAIAKNDTFQFETIGIDFGDAVVEMTRKDLIARIKNTKDRMAQSLAAKGLDTNDIARTLDINPKALEGEVGRDWQTEANMFHRDALRAGGVDPEMPRHLLATKDVTFTEGIDAVDALTYLKSEAKIMEMRRQEIAAMNLGQEFAGKIVPFSEETMLRGATRLGGGPGVVTSTLGSHLSLEAKASYVGGSQTAIARKAVREETESYLGTYANQMVNDQETALAWSALNAERLATTERYVVGELDGEVGLISKKFKAYQDKLKAAQEAGEDTSLIAKPQLQEGAREFISFGGNQKLEGIVRAHISQTGRMNAKIALAKHARDEVVDGASSADEFFGIRPDPKDFQHFALVIDTTITGAGKVRMVQATSGTELKVLTDGIDKTRFDVVFKDQSERYHKALQDYNYDDSIHELYFDTGKTSKGRTAPFFPMTDPQAIARQLLNHHVRRGDHMVRETIKTVYEPVFAGLEKLGQQYSDAATSRFGGFGRFGKEKVYNPYTSYTKMMLDLPQEELMPTYLGVSRVVDKAFSTAYDNVRGIFMSKGESGVDEAYRAMEKAGYNTAYIGSADGLYSLINKQVSKGMLSKFIRTVNVVIGTTMLRSDMFNAINNKLGSVILDSTELNYLTREIAAKSEGKVGALAKMSLETPTGDVIRSPAKLLAEANAAFFSSDPAIKAFKAELEAQGIMTSLGRVNDALIADMTFTGAETDALMSSKIKGMVDKARMLGEKAEKWTGNKLAEENNRFVTAYAVKQITDEAVAQGIISQPEAWVVIRSHVDRVHGNIVASQRPLLFQGPVGQAFGLFQSYQFNLMQQLFRYVGEGNKKDTLMLLGMQGTMYGMHGLPAFDFLNTHIVGQASGNKEHRDAYDAVYGVAGKTVGDWLLYGAPSNLMGMALYTRGDINPRHATILPLNPTKLPQWEIPAKALGNLRDTFKMYGDTGDAWGSIVRGLERNALSRPLSGLGSILQGYTTTAQGNISYAGPMEYGMDLATLTHMARLGGAKPMQEAVVNDAVFRLDTYAAADLAKRKELGKNLKSQLAGGGELDEAQLTSAFTAYAESGGKQKNFARWMGELYRGANESQANALANNLESPFAQRLQIYMGAEDRPDFWY